MDISLEEIKEILSYNDLNKIINFLRNALNKASNKIYDLNIAINKINRAKNYYENKLKNRLHRIKCLFKNLMKEY